MKVIISPAKTIRENSYRALSKPVFIDKYNEVVDKYPSLVDMSKKMCAIYMYNGLVYKQFDREKWDEDFVQNHLVILSATYGAIRPYDEVSPDRMDFLKASSLYKFWGEDVFNKFFKDEIIVNLASEEFSKMISKYVKEENFIDFSFTKDGKKHATTSKKARGILANAIMINKIDDYRNIPLLELKNLKFISELSSSRHFHFELT